VDAAAASFCAFHGLGGEDCVTKLRTAVHLEAMDRMLAPARRCGLTCILRYCIDTNPTYNMICNALESVYVDYESVCELLTPVSA
jgi:hypothetical protein